ncbi:MAG TPA: hypothetical protein V6D22_19200 [Candidatus Obscuribacterales bacterium]
MFTLNKRGSQLASRKSKGSVLAEFGPALGILLICFFFPLLNLLGLFTSYGACYLLNTAQTQEAALLREGAAKDPGGLIIKHIPEHWMNRGIGRFALVDKMPTTSVSHTGIEPHRLITVVTKFDCRPWLVVPLPVKVPGLNAPVSFHIENRQPAESAINRGKPRGA